jgi:hypothetical protein
MDESESLSHTKWECKYHVVFHPQMSPEDSVSGIAAAFGGSLPVAGRAEGEPD